MNKRQVSERLSKLSQLPLAGDADSAKGTDSTTHPKVLFLKPYSKKTNIIIKKYLTHLRSAWIELVSSLSSCARMFTSKNTFPISL